MTITRSGKHATTDAYLGDDQAAIIGSPGSGPVYGGHPTQAQAALNAQVFVADLQARLQREVTLTPLQDPTPEESAQMMGGTKYSAEHDGRWPFRLTLGETTALLEMPGLPVAEVRWLDQRSGNIMDFPRIFLSGDSWIWGIGVKVAADALQEAPRPGGRTL